MHSRIVYVKCKTYVTQWCKTKKKQFYNNFIHSLTIKCVWWKDCANFKSFYSRKSHIQLFKKGDFGVMKHTKTCSEYEKCLPGMFCEKDVLTNFAKFTERYLCKFRRKYSTCFQGNLLWALSWNLFLSYFFWFCKTKSPEHMTQKECTWDTQKVSRSFSERFM